jgi:NADH:ubiquinone oxidoreductase subunit E
MESDIVSQIIEKNSSNGNGIISILQEIQSKYSYLPEHALKKVAEETGKSLVDIYGVATFYKSFSLEPRGKHLISVCLGTACHVRGGHAIAEEFEKQLKIHRGSTTPDREVTLETVSCLGACALGPIVLADGHYFSKVKTTKVRSIINETKEGLDQVEIKDDKRAFPLEVNCIKCNHSLMDTDFLIDGYPSIKVIISFGRSHGALWLSCMFGSYQIESEHVIPDGTIANFFCPHCHAELRSGTLCPECAEQMVPMMIPSGGVLQICTKRGCNGHLLDLI